MDWDCPTCGEEWHGKANRCPSCGGRGEPVEE